MLKNALSTAYSLFNPVLLYHSIIENHKDDYLNNLHNVSPDNFYYQLRFLKKYYDFVCIDDFINLNDRKGKCSVTFDDGYQSIFTNALPILRSLNIPAKIYLNGCNFNGNMFWRDLVRELIKLNRVNDFIEKESKFCAEFGITIDNFYGKTKAPVVNSNKIAIKIKNFFISEGIKNSHYNLILDEFPSLVIDPLISYGNHSFNHYVLASLNNLEQSEEVCRNNSFFKERGLQLSQVYFSLPFGADDSYNNHTVDILKSNNYQGALLSRSRLNIYRPHKNNSIPIGLNFVDRFMPVNSKFGFNIQILKLILKSTY